MEATIFNILRNFSLHHLPNLALELSLQNAMVPCAVNQIKQMQQDLFIWAEILCVFSKFHLPLAFLQFLCFFSSFYRLFILYSTIFICNKLPVILLFKSCSNYQPWSLCYFSHWHIISANSFYSHLLVFNLYRKMVSLSLSL